MVEKALSNSVIYRNEKLLLGNGSLAELKILRRTFHSAVKQEKAQRERLSVTCNNGDVSKYTEAIRHYLSSKPARIINLLEQAACLQSIANLNFEDIVYDAGIMDLKDSSTEEAAIYLKHKSSKSFLTFDYGPFNRARQKMIVKALGPSYLPRPWQFSADGNGLPKAIKALSHAISEGQVHLLHLDIKDCFASFQLNALKALLPLPPETVDYVVTGRHDRVRKADVKSSIIVSLLPQARRGLPRGGIHSPFISALTFAKLDWQPADDVTLVNYADDFVLVSKSEKALVSSGEYLATAITHLPGGHFRSHQKQGPVNVLETPVNVFGHRLSWLGNKLAIAPSDANKLKFATKSDEYAIEADEVCCKNDHSPAAYEAVAKFINYVHGWFAAFGACTHLERQKRAFQEYMQFFPAHLQEMELAKINALKPTRLSLADIS